MIGFFPFAPPVGHVATNFGEYATGNAPGDWTILSDPLSRGMTVETLAGSISGRALRVPGAAATGTANRLLARWNKVSFRADTQMLLRVSSSATSPATSLTYGPAARLSDADNYYWAGEWNAGANLFTRIFAKRVGGTSANIATGTLDLAVTAGAWVYVRFEVSGTALSWKHWLSGTSEPGSWTDTQTDADLSTPGGAGAYFTGGGTGNYAYCDYFAVGPAGRNIPVPV